ncbi:D-alanyl-D-alanine carboxypeptidase [Streptomyces rubrisoli]|uniref:D-alanyl-D-alanine carboxypeptidase n=1 Tax=Streptantibioticus rubrisoli TaxID=1387313 RepID=A0ABT1PLL9_9ACTN|nr:D-alanyl-D-alanine carboxypeptidase [Streptantibioticus rubrisoli]MCQ4045468.1 D-alanyl-D-alanine carboxypeptidase [Streptantibioticus rubrisoli]
MVLTNRQALRRPALTVCAAALVGTALFPAATAASAAPHPGQPARTPQQPEEPRPPENMSTIGGDRLAQSGTQVDLTSGVPPLPKISARAWIVSDAETGEVLASHNAHWPLAPASTLKMLFADTLITKFPRNLTHTVTPQDMAGIGDGSSMVGIKENLPYTVQDLWRGVFLRSGNDAVHVLAAMNGGVDKTVHEMQERAKDLQANDTHVVSPDGYDMPGQVSSAYDLSLFARAGLQNADFREYCSTASAQFPGDFKKGTKERETFGIQNTDRLLSGIDGVKPYPGLAGVKNGFTTNAGNTFTGVADHDGVKLLVTVMHPASGDNMVYKETAALLDWGFQAAGKVKPVGTLVAPKSAQSASGGRTEGAKGGNASASAAAAPGSGSGGAAMAAGITAGALAVLGGVALVVRKRWPLPKRRGES